jgi:hypothetical protein
MKRRQAGFFKTATIIEHTFITKTATMNKFRLHKKIIPQLLHMQQYQQLQARLLQLYYL